MKVKVSEKCIGCGSCISLTDSTIFDYNEEGLAECIKDEIDEKEVDLVEQAISYCPTGAIEKVESEADEKEESEANEKIDEEL